MKRGIIFILFFGLTTTMLKAQQQVIVEGYGSTCTEAKMDALRNAINKTFGSLVYSNTEVKNNELISEEINLLTTGNVLSYEELTSCVLINNNWKIKLNVKVSQNELIAYFEGKGKSISVSGELIKQKTEQEIASKKAELGLINNIIKEAELITIEPFDYEIILGKLTVKENKYCNLPIEIIVKSNLNYYNAFLKIINNVEKISINLADRDFITQTLNEKIFPLTINSKMYYLRNSKSVIAIKKFYDSLFQKIDNYSLVDGCFKVLTINESRAELSITNNDIILLDPEFIVKRINGNYTSTIDEISSLNRINIFPSFKTNQLNNASNSNHNLVLLKYSETNPLEFNLLNKSFLTTLEEISKNVSHGKIGLQYNIYFNDLGINNNSINYLKPINKNTQLAINNMVQLVKLNPSKLCNQYIKTRDSLSIDYQWETHQETIDYKLGCKSDFCSYLYSQELPLGSYTFTTKEKILNKTKYKDISITNYQLRGPESALYSIVIPGLGTRKVTYKKKSGWDRFACVVTPLTLSYLSHFTSKAYYNKYLNATEQEEIDIFFKNANNWNKAKYVFLGLGGTFYVYEILSVLKIGMQNNKLESEIKSNIQKSKYTIQHQPLYQNAN